MKDWLQIKDSSTWIHTTWYEKGIVVLFNGTEAELIEFSNKQLNGINIAPTENSLHFGARHLEVLGGSELTSNAEVEKSRQLLAYLQQGAQSLPADRPAIVNRQNGEVFFALPVGQGTEASGSYVYPWRSSTSDAEPVSPAVFAGCKQFVSASCLFGASLSGEDANGYAIPLIKHDIEFASGQQIGAIRVHSDNLYYKNLMQEDLKQTLKIIQHYEAPSTAGKPTQLLMHVPYLDYILFGVRLYLRNQMTLEALKSLAKVVLDEKKAYQAIIQSQCDAAGIAVKIVSPFEGLIEGIDMSLAPEVVADQILDRLGLCDFTPSEDITVQNQDEFAFTNFALHQLGSKCFLPETDTKTGKVKKIGGREPTPIEDNKFKRNTAFDPTREGPEWQVWHDLTNIALNTWQSGKKFGVEELLHLGNAAVVAFAAQSQSPGGVCSLLPVSEKQIQLGYQSRVRQALDHGIETRLVYPSIINITVMDSVLVFEPGSFRLEAAKLPKAKKTAASSSAAVEITICGPRGSTFYTPVEKGVCLGLVNSVGEYCVAQAHRYVIGLEALTPVEVEVEAQRDSDSLVTTAQVPQTVTFDLLTLIAMLEKVIDKKLDAKFPPGALEMLASMHSPQAPVVRSLSTVIGSMSPVISSANHKYVDTVGQVVGGPPTQIPSNF